MQNATSPEGLAEYNPLLVAAFNVFGGLFG
jgi:hypothetical protein